MKFFFQFYKAASGVKNIYKSLSCSSLLIFEIANHVLASLTASIVHKDGLLYDDSNSGMFLDKDDFMAGKYFAENISFPDDNYRMWIMLVYKKLMKSLSIY